MAVASSDFLFICVGTPSDSADFQYVLQVASKIGAHMKGRKVVLNKSTVPVGAADKVRQKIEKELTRNNQEIVCDVVSNPEFLKEGSAVCDCQKPDRIIMGVESEQAEEGMRSIYSAFNRNHEEIMVMDTRSAELTKYAANTFLATKISFINEMANIAEVVGVDIEKVRRGIGSDPRIGFQFIYPGCGYGGSCFPKDVRALQSLANEYDINSSVVDAVQERNELQKQKLGERLLSCFDGDLSGKVIAIWGLAFKPNTDDIREAPSRVLMETIWTHGGSVRAFDPQANNAFRELYGDRDDLVLVQSQEEALVNADALVICTEWKAFGSPDVNAIRRTLNRPIIIDGRNLFAPAHVASFGIDYYGIGRGLSSTQGFGK